MGRHLHQQDSAPHPPPTLRQEARGRRVRPGGDEDAQARRLRECARAGPIEALPQERVNHLPCRRSPQSFDYNQTYSSAMAPSCHIANVTIRLPFSSSPTTQVQSPEPNPIGWDLTWIGTPPVLSTKAFIAPMCSRMPCVESCPCTSTCTSSVW